jgi:MATE family multidrug resistance protein
LGIVLEHLDDNGVLIPATVLLAVTSIPLSYALIFGKFGFPVMGMRGAALGSLGAEFVTFAFLTVYVVRAFDSTRYELFRYRNVDWRTLRLLTGLSASIATQRSLEVIRWFVFFLILARVSPEAPEALAIANIVYTCYIVFWIPTEGFAETSCSLVSRFVGRNQPEGIGGLLRDTIRGALLVTVPFLILAVCTAIPLGWPVEWVWLSLPIAWAVVLFISYLWMRSRMWQRVHI